MEINSMQPKYTPEEIIAKLQAHPKFGSQIKPITKHQSAIICSGLEPAVVIAGAGSGKTETMSARVLWLVINGYVKPDQILGLTFTRKAAGELAIRIRTRLRQLMKSDLVSPELAKEIESYLHLCDFGGFNSNKFDIPLLAEEFLRVGIDFDFKKPVSENAGTISNPLSITERSISA